MEKPRIADGIFEKLQGDLHLFINPFIPSWFVGKEKAAITMHLMDGTRSFDDIVQALKKDFDLPEKQLRAEAEELLKFIESKGMVHGSEPTPDGGKPEFKLQMMWLHITHRCNLRCKYCYITAGQPMENELTTAEVKIIINQFHSVGGEHQTIAISGGEPLMREDLWDIAAHARKLGIALILATNGMLIDREIAEKIRNNFRSVQVSLDGTRERHDSMRGKGSYDGAMKAIKLLAEAGIKPCVNAVVTKNNIDDLGELARIAHQYQLESVKSPPLVEIGKGESCSAPTLAELGKAWWTIEKTTRKLKSNVPMDNIKSATEPAAHRFGFGCGAGINSISVDSDGGVYPCQGAQTTEFLAGNLRSGKLSDIWENSKVFEDWRRATVSNIPGCSECAWRNYCGGGCKLHAVAAHGTIFAPDRYCEMHKRMLEESIWTSTLRKMGRSYDPDERWAKLIGDFEALEGSANHIDKKQ